MELKDLYSEYGKLVIQYEIIQTKMMEVKRKIADKMGGKDEGRNTDNIQRVAGSV